MLYLFEDLVVDTDQRELRRGSIVLPIAPLAYDLLEFLIKNRERVLNRDDLIASIWDGRIVSESAFGSCVNAARSAINDSGADQRLIRTLPRKGLRFVGAVREMQKVEALATADIATQQALPALSLPDRPSIAVLPFTNMSGDPEQEYFADGMVEDIITALSRFSSLFVIARNSSFTYKGRAVDVKQIGRELGVRYVLEGSVRKAANRVRLTGQLVDATNGVHIWADHFDGVIEDIFELQDQITASVVGAIAPKVEQAEIARAARKPIENLDAYDYYLQGMARVHQATKPAIDEALRLFSKSLERDPDFASAYGMTAWCHVWRKMNGWMADSEKEIREAARVARQAVELGRDDPIALAMGGFALAFVRDEAEDGAALIDCALTLNPNLAAGWLLSGWVHTRLGNHEVTIQRATHALRLSPLDPFASLAYTRLGAGHLYAGRYAEASSWAEKGLLQQINSAASARVAAASHALAGRLDQAQKAMARLRQIDPALRVSNLKRMTSFRRAEDLSTFEEGLRKAGLPE